MNINSHNVPPAAMTAKSDSAMALRHVFNIPQHLDARTDVVGQGHELRMLG